MQNIGIIPLKSIILDFCVLKMKVLELLANPKIRQFCETLAPLFCDQIAHMEIVHQACDHLKF